MTSSDVLDVLCCTVQGDGRPHRSGGVVSERFLIGEGVVARGEQAPQGARRLPPGRHLHARGLLTAICEHAIIC